MNEELLARTTVVLLRETAEDLAYVSSRFGVSRSELVRGLLAEPVAKMAQLVRAVPDQPTRSDLRQLALTGLEMVDEMTGEPLNELREIARDDG